MDPPKIQFLMENSQNPKCLMAKTLNPILGQAMIYPYAKSYSHGLISDISLCDTLFLTSHTLLFSFVISLAHT